MTYKAEDVAAVLRGQVDELTTMQLQKLLYYSQACHLAKYGTPLFNEEIQAWRQGPVVWSVFDKFRRLKWVPRDCGGNAAAVTGASLALVLAVAGNYGGMTGDQLSARTHAELPWNAARPGLEPSDASNAVISHESMASYYQNQVKDLPKRPWAEAEALLAQAKHSEPQPGDDSEWGSAHNFVASSDQKSRFRAALTRRLANVG